MELLQPHAIFCSRHAGALLSSLDKRRAEYARRHQPCRWTRLQTVRVRQWRRRQRKLVYSQRQFGIRGSARMLHRSRRALFKAVYCNASGRVFGQGAPSDGSSRHHDASIQRRCTEIGASDCSPLSLSLSLCAAASGLCALTRLGPSPALRSRLAAAAAPIALRRGARLRWRRAALLFQPAHQGCRVLAHCQPRGCARRQQAGRYALPPHKK